MSELPRSAESGTPGDETIQSLQTKFVDLADAIMKQRFQEDLERRKRESQNNLGSTALGAAVEASPETDHSKEEEQ